MTEIPKEMFKKPKLKNYSLEQRKSDGNKPFSPKFSKRKTTKSFVSQGTQQEQEKSQQPTLMARGPSKWVDYLTEEDDDKLLFSGGEDLRDPQCPWSQAFQDTRFQDEIVGDEVHPEFI
ncbi:hypothetical protein Syun_004855 [Stephania yunnanensis]|uniref:Uncharacterized protein n=1 Tax=Stephania yunnanensis TaxID=152371 RepID=A0AAP0L583_9MAGN